MHPPRTRPPAETLAWVERTIGPGARVVAWRRLTGGITSSVHRLTVEHNGRRGPFVLRRWGPDREREPYAIGAVARETAVLTALERSAIPAPRVIGSTTDLAHGGPAVLFSADVADHFLQMYEAEAGRRVDPWWDVHALLSFGPAWKSFLPVQIDGRAPLDVGGMTRRVEDGLERTLRRL